MFLGSFDAFAEPDYKLDETQYPYRGVYEMEVVMSAAKGPGNTSDGAMVSIVRAQVRCVAKAPFTHTRLLRFATSHSFVLTGCGAEYNIRPLHAHEVTKMLPCVVVFLGDKNDSTRIVPA